MTRDKWLLTGAWALMAGVGAFSIYRQVQAPKVDSTILTLTEELTKKEKGSTGQGPKDPLPKMPRYDQVIRSGYVEPFPRVMEFHPREVTRYTPVVPVTVKVLPVPVLGTIKSDLDGVVLHWSLKQPQVDLLEKMTAVPAQPVNFVVLRGSAEGDLKPLITLQSDARSYTDLSADPRKTYLYKVSLTGMETVRYDRSGRMVEVTNLAESPLKATTPANVRLKLVGGDATHALVRVETYDRTVKKWVGKAPVLSTPGEKVAGTGWAIKGLRFNASTLVADVMDDDGVVTSLSTRE